MMKNNSSKHTSCPVRIVALKWLIYAFLVLFLLVSVCTTPVFAKSTKQKTKYVYKNQTVRKSYTDAHSVTEALGVNGYTISFKTKWTVSIKYRYKYKEIWVGSKKKSSKLVSKTETNRGIYSSPSISNLKVKKKYKLGAVKIRGVTFDANPVTTKVVKSYVKGNTIYIQFKNTVGVGIGKVNAEFPLPGSWKAWLTLGKDGFYTYNDNAIQIPHTYRFALINPWNVK